MATPHLPPIYSEEIVLQVQKAHVAQLSQFEIRDVKVPATKLDAESTVKTIKGWVDKNPVVMNKAAAASEPTAFPAVENC